MLKLIGLSKEYKNSGTLAVNNLNLEVKEGEIFGFLGPNGAGKSTTIKMIVSILTPTSGGIEVNGLDLTKNRDQVKKLIGYVSDDHAVPEKLTGREYLNFMGIMYDVPVEQIKESAEKYLELFELTKDADKQIATYSHGMKQKIVTIGAILHKPKLWILDEPLTGLDPKSAYQLKQLMHQHVREGNTVFFSSHVIDVVEKLCDRIAIISKGKLVAVDTLDRLRKNANESLEEVFLNLTTLS
mgnify:CR=1 FL=1